MIRSRNRRGLRATHHRDGTGPPSQRTASDRAKAAHEAGTEPPRYRLPLHAAVGRLVCARGEATTEFGSDAVSRATS